MGQNQNTRPANEMTEIYLGIYKRSEKMGMPDGKKRLGWYGGQNELIATVCTSPREVLKELFPFYQVVLFDWFHLRTSDNSSFSRQRYNGLHIKPVLFDSMVTATLENLTIPSVVRKIRSAKRSPATSVDVLAREASAIFNYIKGKNSLLDQLPNGFERRQRAVADILQALAEYL